MEHEVGHHGAPQECRRSAELPLSYLSMTRDATDYTGEGGGQSLDL